MPSKSAAMAEIPESERADARTRLKEKRRVRRLQRRQRKHEQAQLMRSQAETMASSTSSRVSHSTKLGEQKLELKKTSSQTTQRPVDDAFASKSSVVPSERQLPKRKRAQSSKTDASPPRLIETPPRLLPASVIEALAKRPAPRPGATSLPTVQRKQPQPPPKPVILSENDWHPSKLQPYLRCLSLNKAFDIKE